MERKNRKLKHSIVNNLVLLRDIALKVTLNSGSTTVDASWTLSTFKYTKSVMNGDFDETTKTLMKDMLAYAASAHTYFASTDGVTDKLAEIETLLADYTAEVPILTSFKLHL